MQPRDSAYAVPQYGADVPGTSVADVDRHTEMFSQAVADLLGQG
jgi:hypothetical protein